jgi:hypothetical protein
MYFELPEQGCRNKAAGLARYFQHRSKKFANFTIGTGGNRSKTRVHD